MPRSEPSVSPGKDTDQLLSSYVFDLPDRFIAQRPVEPRHAARLLAVEPLAVDPKPLAEAAYPCRHLTVWDLQHALMPGDLLVVNNTRVLKARLQVRRSSGGAVELLVLEQTTWGVWLLLVMPSNRANAVVVLRPWSRRASECCLRTLRLGLPTMRG